MPRPVPRWLHSVQELLTGFGQARTQRKQKNAQHLETIRGSMIDLLPMTSTRQAHWLHKRLRQAREVQDLWYLRSDLLQALARVEGEKAARQRLTKITALFEGVLPAAMLQRSTDRAS